MDLWGAFVGDSALSVGSLRGAYHRDFEQFPYGTLEHNSSAYAKDPYSRVQEKCRQIKAEKEQRKQCPFCKEHKKRPLINYLRRREMREHHESICEGVEEEVGEEEEEAEEHVHVHEHAHAHQEIAKDAEVVENRKDSEAAVTTAPAQCAQRTLHN